MMKLYRCADCGNTFAEDEIATWKEERGEFWGAPAYEKMSGCPFCHSGDISEYTETEEGDENDG